VVTQSRKLGGIFDRFCKVQPIINWVQVIDQICALPNGSLNIKLRRSSTGPHMLAPRSHDANHSADICSAVAPALIIDLRDNKGGSITAAIDCAALFHPEGAELLNVRHRSNKYLGSEYFDKAYTVAARLGRILQSAFPPVSAALGVKYREEFRSKVFGFGRYTNDRVYSKNSNPDSTTPLLVLTNRNTASASELLTMALQQHGRAVVAGDKTFGKNVAQVL
jgi:hypothetical protein